MLFSKIPVTQYTPLLSNHSILFKSLRILEDLGNKEISETSLATAWDSVDVDLEQRLLDRTCFETEPQLDEYEEGTRVGRDMKQNNDHE